MCDFVASPFHRTQTTDADNSISSCSRSQKKSIIFLRGVFSSVAMYWLFWLLFEFILDLMPAASQHLHAVCGQCPTDSYYYWATFIVQEDMIDHWGLSYFNFNTRIILIIPSFYFYFYFELAFFPFFWCK